VGSGNSNYEAQLKILIARLHLEKNVLLLGQISQSKKYHLLAASWLHIQPSFKEGFGLTILEAAAVGTPTICFNVPGLRDVVRDGMNGIVVKKMTPEALGETLQTLLSHPRKINQLSKSSNHWAKTLPSWKKQTKLLENLLFKTLTDSQQRVASAAR
jgi:glycosyltransferase involved in cell wall biosynthesis